MHRLNLSNLKPAPYNPRTITPEALSALKVSLTTFGDISGIVWNKRSGHLVAGHQRMETLRHEYGDNLKLEDGMIVTPTGYRFPVRVVDWPDSKEKAANIAANSPTLAGEFTGDLASLLDEIKVQLPELADGLRLDLIPVAEPPEVSALKPLTLVRPIQRVWILLGIPAEEYAQHADAIDLIAHVEGAFYDSTIR